MAYKNIYYDRVTEKVHLWTDEGYTSFDFQRYGYIPTPKETGITTITGQNVEKVFLSREPHDSSQFFESDVISEVRTLVDRYYEDDSKPTTHTIIGLDIETAKSATKGYAKPENPFNEVTAITIHNFRTNEKHTLLYDPYEKYRQDAYNLEGVETFHNEKHLLRRFIRLWREIKPSIITGWNSEFYDIPYLYLRLKRQLGSKIANMMSPIDQVYVKEVDRENKIFNPSVRLAGISHLDYMQLYKNYTFKKLPSYKLDFVSLKELDRRKVEHEHDLQWLWENDINKFAHYNVIDVDLLKKLEDKLRFIDLHITLSHLAHVPYEMAMSTVRLIEGKVLTETKKRNMVCPNVQYIETDPNEVEKIVGAYVRDSKKGLFEFLFDVDLTSLYPMTDVTVNISYETKVGKIRDYIDVWMEKDKVKYRINKPIFDETKKIPDRERVIDVVVEDYRKKKAFRMRTIGDLYGFLDENNYTLSCNGIMYDKSKMGLIPEIILEIFETRSHYKNLRKEADNTGDESASQYYDSMQMCYKIFLNSIYGVLCNKYFRLFDKENAQSITLTGQYTNKSAMDSIGRVHKLLAKEVDLNSITPKEKLLFEDPIITGDTDSIILSAVPSLICKHGSNWKDYDDDFLLDEVIGISKIMAEVANKRCGLFAKHWLNSDDNYLEFKEEWVARTGFYVGVKKRYANWIKRQEGVPKDYVDVKGLDIIRSSFPKHLQDFMEQVLFKILYMHPKDEVFDYIKTVRNELVSVDYKNNIMYISVISSANNLWKYIKNGEPIKGTPFHIKGVANYNKLINYKNLRASYNELYEGDRIGVVYLRKNPYGFESISYPFDDIPPEINDFIMEFVDVDESVDRLLENKLKTFYNAMEWTAPNLKYNDITQFFV